MKCLIHYEAKKNLLSIDMGNNLQALQTAKSLTNKITSKEPYLPVSNGEGFQIPRHNVLKKYLSPSSNSVTSQTTSHNSDQQNGIITNNNGADSFVYYLSDEHGNNSHNRDILHSTHEQTNTSDGQTVNGLEEMVIGIKNVQKDASQPDIVDLTLDDSEEEDLSSTLPKIIAAYSLSEHVPFTDLSNLLPNRAQAMNGNGIVLDSMATSSKSNESVVESVCYTKDTESEKKDLSVVNSTLSHSSDPHHSHDHQKARPNGLVLNNRQKTLECESLKDLLKNQRISSAEITKHLTSQAPEAVMQDVTNTHNDESYVHRQNCTPQTEDHSEDDNVVITKVVATSGTKGRQKHRRKAPIEVRKWCFEEQKNDVQFPEHTNCQSRGTVKNTQRSSPSMQRETKIKTLKNLLSKQATATDKINLNSSLVATNRMLVVQIPDLKSELQIPKSRTHCFRVSSQTISINSKDNISPRKRQRKSDPRKISRSEHQYPSYVETSDEQDGVSKKKLKGKQKLARKRGRNSPSLDDTIPVQSKDLWHKELEKVEGLLATGESLNQTSFMLFLGLRKV